MIEKTHQQIHSLSLTLHFFNLLTQILREIWISITDYCFNIFRNTIAFCAIHLSQRDSWSLLIRKSFPILLFPIFDRKKLILEKRIASRSVRCLESRLSGLNENVLSTKSSFFFLTKRAFQQKSTTLSTNELFGPRRAFGKLISAQKTSFLDKNDLYADETSFLGQKRFFFSKVKTSL